MKADRETPSHVAVGDRGRTPEAQGWSRRELSLLLMVVAFYLATRLVALADFPIFFFCDEAIHANLARDLVDRGFRDPLGHLFPAYFRNVTVYNLALSVWVHVLPVVLFGKSVFVVRATSVAVGLAGVVALMVALRRFYGVRLWWLGGLVMAAIPAWFLHSRTAFETAMMVGFYALFVLSYLSYRKVSPRWLFATLGCAAATFYSYSNGQGVIFITLLVLLVVDWRYHWQVIRRHPRLVLGAAIVAVLLAAPYLRFRWVLHPEMVSEHLANLESYWLHDISLQEKLTTFATIYGRGLGPKYWFTEDGRELFRHRMKGMGHLPLWLAPALALGLVMTLLRAPRSPADRLTLIAVAAAPFAASLVGLRITRVLAMVVPVTILATVGLDQLRWWLRRLFPEAVFGALVALAIASTSVVMAVNAVHNGPTWFRDYALYGMQYGARQVFEMVREHLATDPSAVVTVSHSWANNPNAFRDFFLEEEEWRRTHMGSLENLLREPQNIPDGLDFVLTAEEFTRARASSKLVVGQPLRSLAYPDGRLGFVLVHLRYSEAAAEMFEAERVQRRKLVETTVTVEGRASVVRHPSFDIGAAEDMFDGDTESLARTLDADPAVIEIDFLEPRTVAGARLHLWSRRYVAGLRVSDDSGEVSRVSELVSTDRLPPVYEIWLPEPVVDATGMVVVLSKWGDFHIHVREIEILSKPRDAPTAAHTP